MSVSDILADPNSNIGVLKTAILELQRQRWDPDSGRIERLENQVKALAELTSELSMRLNSLEARLKAKEPRVLHTSTGIVELS